jgi:hypothetical protein
MGLIYTYVFGKHAWLVAVVHVGCGTGVTMHQEALNLLAL